MPGPDQIAFTDKSPKVCTRVFRAPGTVAGTNSGTPVRSDRGVLSIAKLRVGQEAYQLSGVAQSLDDYYTGVGEAAGHWIGAGAERLGLSGDVTPDDLRAVLAGMAPGTGGLTPNGETIRPHPRRVPGFDLTFKTPKSVSVLYAVTDDPRVQGAIIDAGETAVRAALGWLEREAVHVRRGTGNEKFLTDLAARDPDAADAARIRTLPARGVVAATFRHRTSRAGDPLLHWHTLVANLVEGPDGRWSAFVHPDLYRAVRAAGEVFQTVLRAELTERLGVEWRPGRHVGEIAGVPQSLCDVFSKRSREIEAWLQATGIPDDPAGRQQAVLATRRHKPEVEHQRFDTTWKAEALDAGWGPEAAEALIAAATGQVGDIEELWRLPEPIDDGAGGFTVVDRAVDPEQWVASVCRDLTESDSTFTRPQLVQAVAARLGDGATMATLERVVARVIASASVVPVGDSGDRWTSLELLEVERRFLRTANATRSTLLAVPPHLVETMIDAATTPGDDQIAAIRTLAGCTDAVSVLVGPAGTGKTYTLDTIRTVYETAGHRVIGAAPSARAAHELETGSHITAVTLHRLIGSWSRGFDLPDSQTVLVVDEAAMAGVRDLEHAITRTVVAGGRVLLVGDHRQLPEVTAGGGFAALATNQHVTVAELTVNRRQHHQWERHALGELRDGNVAAAVAAYRDHDRVVIAADRPAMLTAAVDRWFDARTTGLSPVLIAGTNDTVHALNRTVRNTLIERGQLGDTIGTWAGRDLALGDRVVLRINDYTASTTAGAQAAVLNGHTATVTAGDQSAISVRLDHDDTEITIGSDYLIAGGVDHGYALTAHRAQGGTWDLAIAVGADGLYREAAYLVLSRGRHENWLVLTAPDIEALDAELARHDSPLHLPGEDIDLHDHLDRRFNTTRAKRLALTDDPDAHHVALLADRHDLATLEARADRARNAELRATTIAGIDPAAVRPKIERAVHTATHVAVGQSVKAHDRNNIGTVVAIDDEVGTVGVRFVATDGRQATRTLRWADVQIMHPADPEPRPLTPSAQQRLDEMVRPVHDQLNRWHRILAEHGVAPGERNLNDRAARLAIDRAAARLAAAQPDWLTRVLGTRPTPPAAAQVWDDTVRRLAAHRTRHHIHDPHHPLGPQPTDPDHRHEWDRGHEVLARARIWLHTHSTTPTVPITRTRSAHELEQRRHQLDGILATAPADHRGLVDRIRSGETLPFDNITDTLTEALANQGERRRWILEHWPHVVEYTQVIDTLQSGHPGANHTALLEHLANVPNQRLAQAAADAEPWLVHLAPILTTEVGGPPSATLVQLLGNIAEHRARWAITDADPLGIAAADVDHAIERRLLTLAIKYAYEQAHPDPVESLEAAYDHHPTAGLLDNGIAG